MLKRVPDGMYFDCRNAVRRSAIYSLKRFLVKFNIKSASPQDPMVFTAARARVILNGAPIAYAQGVSYVSVSSEPIDVIGSDD